jgi:hypothetical protein
MKVHTTVLLTFGMVALAALPCLSANRKQSNPHEPNAKHPEKVARIMKLLPRIPVDASYDKIITFLGLPKDWDSGSVSTTHCTMVWNIAPSYQFALNFDPLPRDGKIKLVFTDAYFSARGKRGFPPDEFHTIYPYHARKGMVQK